MIGPGARLGTVLAPTTGAADIWFARVGEHAAEVNRLAGALLTAEEREKLSAYRTRDTAERFVVTRALVRCVLADRLGVAPTDVPIRQTGTGKPIVEGVHFNVSHSGDLVLLAASAEREVGIDLERRRDIHRVEALVQRWLTPEEREDVGRRIANGAAPSEAFLRVWSFKEARLKALGVGIARASTTSFRAVDAVPLDDLLEQIAGAGDAGYVGALAFA